MPEYLAPGVYIEETSFRGRSIEGVSTSVAAVVGPTRTGPLRGVPEPVTSFNDFTRVYGDLEDLDFEGTKQLNYTALAASAFFANGGKQLFVSRVVGGVNSSSVAGDDSSADRASVASTGGVVTFRARFPGAVGNYTLELLWRDSENLYSTQRTTTPAEGETLLLTATGVPSTAKVGGATLANGEFPISINAVVQRSGANLTLLSGEATTVGDADIDLAGELDSALVLAELPSATTTLTRVVLRSPASGKLSVGDAAELTLTAEHDISAVSGVDHWGSLTTLRGTLTGTGDVINSFTIAAALNDGVSSDLVVPLQALAALPSGSAMMVRRNFDIDVLSGGKTGEVIYKFTDISSASTGSSSLQSRLPANPEKKSDALTQPVSCALTAGDVLGALNELFDSDAINNPDPLRGARYLITLAGGSDGSAPVAGDYGGEVDDSKGNTGLAAFEDIEDISIVMAPAAAVLSNTQHVGVVTEVQKHCMKLRYRIGIVDSPKDASIGEVREFRNNFSDSRLALYYPWIVTIDPTGQRDTLVQPPSGFIAGVYAGTDVRRGVHKPPANEPILGALRFNQEVNRFQQELLNPVGVNCLRSFPARGHRVWGARTLTDDPEWRYVNVRRYFLFLERSIEKSTQWAVFEPNGEALWANVRSAVNDFLFSEWRNGHLLGATPKEAFFVRCDRSTMTQNDIDNGRLVCEVGVAPLKPAEFVIFRIGQKTADA